MAPGPLRSLRFIHAAIRAQAQLVEDGSLALDGPGGVAALADTITTLTSAVRGHAEAEDVGFFPALAERAEHAVAAFAFDHESEHERLDELDRLAAGCTSNDEVRALQRAAAVTREHLELHMAKEEQILWPLAEELFSPPEQGALVQAILAAVPKESFETLMPWMVEVMTLDDAVAYVQTLERVQPPEVFAVSREWIRNGISIERLAAVRERGGSLDS